MKTTPYDAIVIGAGQSGGPLSTALAKAGQKTAIIERVHVGGTCVNEGCTPTKTMVASARIAHLVRRSADYGVHTGPVTVDILKVRQRKREIVESFRTGSERHIEGTEGLDLLRGEAQFTGPKELEVMFTNGEISHLTAPSIFINVGCRPATLPIPGIENVDTLDSTSIMELGTLPEHLLVIGGGYIGLEFGQMFRRFGSRVTIIQHGAHLLAREDQDVSEEVAKILTEDGIEVLLETTPSLIEQLSEDIIQLHVQTPAGKRVLGASHVLIATGRIPNTDFLQPEIAGIRMDKKGYIHVNEKLETNMPGIYAMGDVKGGPAFTHISYDDFRIIRTNLLDNGNATTKDRFVPYTVFIDPQLGRVGLTESEANSQHRSIKVAKMPMTHVARALEVDETRGFLKAIVDAETDQILGFTALGIEGGEVMSIIEVAMMGKVPYTALRDGIFAHPTLAESLNNLFSAL
jgi:pyruvate/2-oxoglutarate dehydrogenase complex dihydrolipoamide dehydrogenase (E3) component